MVYHQLLFAPIPGTAHVPPASLLSYDILYYLGNKKEIGPAGSCRADSCGESEIRTRDTLLGYTRFPGVPLQPLEHLSNVGTANIRKKSYLAV